VNAQTLVAVLLVVPALLLAPGYFTVVTFLGARCKPVDWTFPEALFTIVGVSVFVVSVCGLLLAEFGIFSIRSLLAGVFVYTLAWEVLYTYRRVRWTAQPSAPAALLADGGENVAPVQASSLANIIGLSCLPRPRWEFESIGILSVAVLALLLFVQPFDYIIGGLDSGTYVNTGINIARTGAIISYDSAVVGLSRPEADLFFSDAHKPWVFGSRLVGFYLVDLASGAVQPQGFHLYPVWIAILYSLGGVKAGLLATPLFGLLGVLGLYFLGKRLFDSRVGILAAFFLTISVAQIYFSRTPLSEVAVQFFLLAGLYLFALAIDNYDKFFAALAGVSLGMAHLAKIELILLPFSVIGFTLLASASRRFRPEYWYVLAGYLAMLGYAVLHAAFVANVYSLEVINNTWLPMINSFLPGSVDFISKICWRQPTTVGDLVRTASLVAAPPAIGLIVWVATRLGVSRMRAVPRWASEALRLAFFASVAGLAAYAWFVRPAYPPVDPSLPQVDLAGQVNNRSSLIRLGWYISPLGVLFGVAGFAKAFLDATSSKFLFFVAVATPTTVLLLYNSFITPVHFWAERRFVYIVIPAFLLLAAYAIYGLRRSSSLAWRRDIVPVSIGIAVALTVIRPAVPFLAHVDYAGAEAQLAQVAAALPDDSVVLFDYSLEYHMFSVPLKYLYAKDVRMLPQGALSDPRLQGLLDRYEADGKRVFWITPASWPNNLPQGFSMVRTATMPINLPETPNAQDSLPGKPHLFSTTLEIYEIISNRSARTAGSPRLCYHDTVGGRQRWS